MRWMQVASFCSWVIFMLSVHDFHNVNFTSSSFKYGYDLLSDKFMRMGFESFSDRDFRDRSYRLNGTGMDGTCSEKRCLFLTQGTVYVLERYLLSSVPNQVLNSPSSLLNDACNRTRLQHTADKTTEPEGHLDIFSATFVTFQVYET